MIKATNNRLYVKEFYSVKISSPIAWEMIAAALITIPKEKLIRVNVIGEVKLNDIISRTPNLANVKCFNQNFYKNGD